MATEPLAALLNDLQRRLTLCEGSLGLPSGGGVAAPAAAPEAAFVTQFDSYCDNTLGPFIAACDALGGAPAKSGATVKKAWAAQRDFLVKASKSKKPDAAALQAALGPLQACIKEADTNIGRDEWETHSKAVKDGLACLSWVAVAPPMGTPGDVVESAVGGAEYYANKIRVQYRKTGPQAQVDFCDTFKALLVGLQEYVVAQHKLGITWNPKGGNFGDAEASAPAPAAAPASAPAPAASARPVGGIGNVLGQLSGGLDVTKGLKKVTKDQQTWRSEFKGGDAPPPPVKEVPKPAPTVAAAVKPKGPPKLEFASNKWSVENQGKDAGVVTVEVTSFKHTVYIYSCSECTIDVKGKCNGVAVDGCKKVHVFVENCISSVEVVNCKNVQITVRQKVPIVAIDKTDGFICHLSAESLDTKFTSAKSSEMNVSFPTPCAPGETVEAGDITELPIPEQFIHTLQNVIDKAAGEKPKIASDVSELYSH